MAIDEKEAFCELALQYLVTARFAALTACLMPVSGNLYHHAIEMLLKGCLGSNTSLMDLKKFGHNLSDLWAEFKQTTGDQTLDRFDQTIVDLDRFEKIRYPDAIISKGMIIGINIKHDPRPHIGAKGSSTPYYQIVTEVIDELVKFIFGKTTWNPRFFTTSLNKQSMLHLNKDNQSPLD